MLSEYKAVTDTEKAEVVALGGLHVVGTERHESRRIDNQLRGRSGRQVGVRVKREKPVGGAFAATMSKSGARWVWRGGVFWRNAWCLRGRVRGRCGLRDGMVGEGSTWEEGGPGPRLRSQPVRGCRVAVQKPDQQGLAHP